jgi:hypothetical protein
VHEYGKRQVLFCRQFNARLGGYQKTTYDHRELLIIEAEVTSVFAQLHRLSPRRNQEGSWTVERRLSRHMENNEN